MNDALQERYGRFNPAWLVGAWPVESRVEVEDFASRTARDSLADQLRFTRAYGATVEGHERVSVEGSTWRPYRATFSGGRYRVEVEACDPDDVRASDIPDMVRRPIYSDAQRAVIRLAVRAGMPWDSIAQLVGEDVQLDGEPVEDWRPITAHSSDGRDFEVGRYPVGGSVEDIRRWRFGRAVGGRLRIDSPTYRGGWV